MLERIFNFSLIISIIHFIILSVISIRARKSARKAYGTNQDRLFQAKIRAHANFAEYTPIILILLFILSNTNLEDLFFLVLCSIFVIGRILHSLGLLWFEHRQKPIYKFRVAGMACTFFVLIVGCIKLIIINI